MRTKLLMVAGATLAVSFLAAPAGAVPQWCPTPSGSVGPGYTPGDAGGGGSQGGGTVTGGGGGVVPGAGGGGAVTGASAPTTTYVPIVRGATSKRLLDIDWEFPVFDPNQGTEAKEGESSASYLRQALPVSLAFAQLAAGDYRPLLVLRECASCNGTDDALLSRSESNEKTMILSKWFRCVKLPQDVLEAEHPFHNVFGGEDPPHLFVSKWDGSALQPLKGDQSRSELWSVMTKLLDSEYEKDASRALKDLFKLLDKFDMIDDRISLLAKRVDDLIEKKGPDSSKVKKARKDLEKAEAKRKALLEEQEELMELVLQLPAEVTAPAEES